MALHRTLGQYRTWPWSIWAWGSNTGLRVELEVAAPGAYERQALHVSLAPPILGLKAANAVCYA
eukprot:1497800-Rhodomonas_salina.1